MSLQYQISCPHPSPATCTFDWVYCVAFANYLSLYSIKQVVRTHLPATCTFDWVYCVAFVNYLCLTVSNKLPTTLINNHLHVWLSVQCCICQLSMSLQCQTSCLPHSSTTTCTFDWVYCVAFFNYLCLYNVKQVAYHTHCLPTGHLQIWLSVLCCICLLPVVFTVSNKLPTTPITTTCMFQRACFVGLSTLFLRCGMLNFTKSITDHLQVWVNVVDCVFRAVLQIENKRLHPSCI